MEKYIKYTKEENDKLLELAKCKLSREEIYNQMNSIFPTKRTFNAVNSKLSTLCSKHGIKTYKPEDKVIYDEKIVELVKQYPTNLAHAFTIASKELNVDFKTIQNRYYQKLRRKCIMLTVGSKIGFSNNVKNTKRDAEGNFPAPDMNDVQWLMKHILNLSKSDRDKIKLLLE